MEGWSRLLDGSSCYYVSKSSAGGVHCSREDVPVGLEDGDWIARYEYGKIYGGSECVSSTTCRCRLDGFKPDNGALQTLSEESWFYLSNSYNNNTQCKQKCPTNCITKLGKDSELRVKKFGQAQYLATCSLATDSDSCFVSFTNDAYKTRCDWRTSGCYDHRVSDCAALSSENACTGTVSYSRGSCKWANSACHNAKVDDCAAINNESLCVVSSSKGACVWVDSHCIDSVVDDCTTITNSSLCSVSSRNHFNSDYDKCGWSGSVCYNTYVDSCSEVQDSTVCDSVIEYSNRRSWDCYWDGASCVTDWND